jgi:hypothetical protein
MRDGSVSLKLFIIIIIIIALILVYFPINNYRKYICRKICIFLDKKKTVYCYLNIWLQEHVTQMYV